MDKIDLTLLLSWFAKCNIFPTQNPEMLKEEIHNLSKSLQSLDSKTNQTRLQHEEVLRVLKLVDLYLLSSSHQLSHGNEKQSSQLVKMAKALMDIVPKVAGDVHRIDTELRMLTLSGLLVRRDSAEMFKILLTQSKDFQSQGVNPYCLTMYHLFLSLASLSTGNLSDFYNRCNTLKGHLVKILNRKFHSEYSQLAMAQVISMKGIQNENSNKMAFNGALILSMLLDILGNSIEGGNIKLATKIYENAVKMLDKMPDSFTHAVESVLEIVKKWIDGCQNGQENQQDIGELQYAVRVINSERNMGISRSGSKGNVNRIKIPGEFQVKSSRHTSHDKKLFSKTGVLIRDWDLFPTHQTEEGVDKDEMEKDWKKSKTRLTEGSTRHVRSNTMNSYGGGFTVGFHMRKTTEDLTDIRQLEVKESRGHKVTQSARLFRPSTADLFKKAGIETEIAEKERSTTGRTGSKSIKKMQNKGLFFRTFSNVYIHSKGHSRNNTGTWVNLPIEESVRNNKVQISPALNNDVALHFGVRNSQRAPLNISVKDLRTMMSDRPTYSTEFSEPTHKPEKPKEADKKKSNFAEVYGLKKRSVMKKSTAAHIEISTVRKEEVTKEVANKSESKSSIKLKEPELEPGINIVDVLFKDEVSSNFKIETPALALSPVEDLHKIKQVRQSLFNVLTPSPTSALPRFRGSVMPTFSVAKSIANSASTAKRVSIFPGTEKRASVALVSRFSRHKHQAQEQQDQNLRSSNKLRRNGLQPRNTILGVVDSPLKSLPISDELPKATMLEKLSNYNTEHMEDIGESILSSIVAPTPPKIGGLEAPSPVHESILNTTHFGNVPRLELLRIVKGTDAVIRFLERKKTSHRIAGFLLIYFGKGWDKTRKDVALLTQSVHENQVLWFDDVEEASPRAQSVVIDRKKYSTTYPRILFNVSARTWISSHSAWKATQVRRLTVKILPGRVTEEKPVEFIYMDSPSSPRLHIYLSTHLKSQATTHMGLQAWLSLMKYVKSHLEQVNMDLLQTWPLSFSRKYRKHNVDEKSRLMLCLLLHLFTEEFMLKRVGITGTLVVAKEKAVANLLDHHRKELEDTIETRERRLCLIPQDRAFEEYLRRMEPKSWKFMENHLGMQTAIIQDTDNIKITQDYEHEEHQYHHPQTQNTTPSHPSHKTHQNPISIDELITTLESSTHPLPSLTPNPSIFPPPILYHYTPPLLTLPFHLPSLHPPYIFLTISLQSSGPVVEVGDWRVRGVGEKVEGMEKIVGDRGGRGLDRWRREVEIRVRKSIGR